MSNLIKRAGGKAGRRAYAYGAWRAFRNLCVCGALLFVTFGADCAQAEARRLVALGDSLTAGYGLMAEEGLVAQLQGWLDAKGAGVVVENAGVSGDTTAGGAARLDWALGGGADALMVILGGNDMMRGIAPAEVRANLTQILEGARARNLPVLLVGMKAPANWGPGYKAEFDAIYPDVAATYKAVFLPDFFTGLTALGANPSDPASLARWMQGDGIHPNAEGVEAIVTGLGPAVLDLLEAAR